VGVDPWVGGGGWGGLRRVGRGVSPRALSGSMSRAQRLAARHAARNGPDRLTRLLPQDVLALILEAYLPQTGEDFIRTGTQALARYLCIVRLTCKAFLLAEFDVDGLWGTLLSWRWSSRRIAAIRTRSDLPARAKHLYSVLHLRSEKPEGSRFKLKHCIDEAFRFCVVFTAQDASNTFSSSKDELSFCGRHGFHASFEHGFDFLPVHVALYASRDGGKSACLVRGEIPWDQHQDELDGRRYLCVSLRDDPLWSDEPLKIRLNLVWKRPTRTSPQGPWLGCQLGWCTESQVHGRLSLGVLWAALCKQVF
jgi:hypothetical protein